MTQCKIVILEKDQRRRDYLRWMLTDLGYIPFTFEKENICLDNLSRLEPELVISGSLSRDRLYRFINTLKMIDRHLPVLTISGDRSVQDFVNTNGFNDVTVMSAEFEPTKIKGFIARILDSRSMNIAAVAANSPLIVGNCPEMVKIKKSVSELGLLTETVLIQGELGTGKELVARAIHTQSDRSDQAFVKVNFAEMTPERLDEFFFDVQTSSLQSEHQNRSRIFAAAKSGTLFLREIGAIPVSHQGMLIGFFENDYNPHSGKLWHAHTTPDVRLVVSSSHALEQLVLEGKFRKDLYYRLNDVAIEIPPLRDRNGDISLLTDFFVDRFCIELDRVHYEFSNNTKDAFGKYHWPGNVRELKQLVRSAVLTCDENSIFLNLPARMNTRMDKGRVKLLGDQVDDIYKLAGLNDLKKSLNNLDSLSLKTLCRKYSVRTEKKIIKKALEHTNWNRKKASCLLNISYKSLLTKIKMYNLR